MIPNYQGVRHILSGKNIEEVSLNVGEFSALQEKAIWRRDFTQLVNFIQFRQTFIGTRSMRQLCNILQKQRRIKRDCCTPEVRSSFGQTDTLDMYSLADNSELQS